MDNVIVINNLLHRLPKECIAVLVQSNRKVNRAVCTVRQSNYYWFLRTQRDFYIHAYGGMIESNWRAIYYPFRVVHCKYKNLNSVVIDNYLD